MKPISWRMISRSFRFKALFVATMSLALVVAILFGISSAWLKRERLETERQRAEELLNFLATNLQIGVMVHSPELIRPVLEQAQIAKEVKAVAAFATDGTLLGQVPQKGEDLASFHSPALVQQVLGGRTAIVAQDPNCWVLAAGIEKEVAPEAKTAPADFMVVSPGSQRQTIGTVLLFWDLTPGAHWVSEFQHRFLSFSAAAFGLVAVPTWLLTLYLNRGFSQLLKATQHIQRGDLHYQIGSRRNDELGDVMRAFDSMVERTAKMTEQIQQERERALAASKAKSEFLANMSHELRTPLNAVIGFSEVLLEPVFGELTEKQKSYVEDILESGKHLLCLINDILDLAKIESGKIDLEKHSVELPKLLNSSLRLFRERAAKHRIEISVEIERGLELIYADERRLKQLLFNLLSNAVKFTPDGGKVGVRAWSRGDSVTICVWDAGIGIPVREHQRIFEDFQQVDSSLVRSQQGTGLGLSLVRKITELHGGRVWVESKVGQGSQFFVELPTHTEDIPKFGPPEIAYAK